MKRIQGRSGERSEGVMESWSAAPNPLLHHSPTPALPEICLLAGGLSSRMGRDKARLRLGGESFVSHIRSEMRSLGFPVRVLRRDLISRCGPLGGVYTGLVKARSDVVIFLACDMPLVSAAWVRKIAQAISEKTPAVFSAHENKVGFPFALNVSLLQAVEKQIAAKEFSLNVLARQLKARALVPPRNRGKELFNVNTPEDLRVVRGQVKGKRKKSPQRDL